MRPSLFLALPIVVTLVSLLTVAAGDVDADMGPLVDRPSDFGPMTVGHVDDTIRFTTKSYDTQVRIYYPADDYGMGTAPDASGAPYLTVVWMPFFGGPYDILDYQGEHLASYGAVVVAFGVNWNDFGASGNAADLNELLDYLEDRNTTTGDTLYGMVDEEAFGICGHSSGGGKSLLGGAQVGRMRATQAFGAAIGASTVDIIAPMFNGRPVLLQVGQEDSGYIANSRRAYQKIGPPCALVETIGGHHSGPFQDHMYVAFFLYHLGGRAEYFTFLYGDEAVAVVAEGGADVYFKLGGDHFFPPELTTSVSTRYTPMDVAVTFNASVRGYQRADDPDLVHGWDVDGDGDSDLFPVDGPNATYTFSAPGTFDVTYNYTLGRWSLLGDPHRVEVTNVLPVAVAGPDVQVDHDGYADLDGSSSNDTASDAERLLFKWTFSDGTGTNVTSHPEVSRQFTEVGVVVATLTVYDPHGGTDTDTLEVTVVNVPPIVETGVQLTVSEDSAATLDGSGSDTPSHADSLEYRWDFGDDISSQWLVSPQVVHAYTRSGNYTAKLTVRDPEMATGSVTTLVIVVNEVPS
ncbi:MAG: PKD domain-containing protein, partial [Thermoplasmata archaeon]